MTNNNESLATTFDITVFPNPANDFLIIETKNLKEYEITIVDVMGKTALSQSSVKQIDISALTSGIYFLKARNSNLTYTSTFIKL